MKQLVRNLFLTLSLGTGLGSTAQAQCKLYYDPTVWKEVFRDDFNGPTLNRNLWDTSPSHNKSANTTLTNTDYSGWGTEWYDYKDPSLVTFANAGGTNSVLVLKAKRWVDSNGNLLDRTVTGGTGATGQRTVSYRSGMVIAGDLGSPNRPKDTSYGAWEARIKCGDNPHAWPAFWLWSSKTEIDVLDGIFPYGSSPSQAMLNNVIDCLYDSTGVRVNNPPSQAPYCGSKFRSWADPGKTVGTRFSDDYHVYTVVWTPDYVTFFFDGRELNTVPKSAVVTRDDYPEIRLTMQMAGNNTDPNETAEMYVDWVRILKPNIAPGNINAPGYGLSENDYKVQPSTFKTASEYLNHDITALASSPMKVSAVAGSIALNPNNAGQVFYRAINNRLYVANQVGTSWQETALPFVNGSTAQGDLVYHALADLLLYRGTDGRLHGYYFDGTNWQHTWLTSAQAARVSSTPGSIAVDANFGRVAYIGQDGQLHYCEFAGTYPWAVEDIINQDGNVAYAAGDVLFDEIQSLVYKGRDDRLQYYWLNNGIYQHAWADDYFSTGSYAVARIPKSVAYCNGHFFYIGRDDGMVHQLAYDASQPNGHSYQPMILPSNSYQYDQTGYPKADRAMGGITANATGTVLTYVGRDGRLQYMSYDNNNWTHGWRDDYWNTGEYRSFDINAASPNQYGSLVTSDAGRAYYCGADQHLRYFEYEACTRSFDLTTCLNNNSTGGYPGSLNRSATVAATAPASPAPTSLRLYPNPTTGAVQVVLPTELEKEPTQFVLYSPLGQVLQQGELTASSPALQLGFYPAGVYLLRLQGAGRTYQTKLVKQ